MDRTAKNDALIWKHTHRDFKGKSDGVKMIMICRNGGSTLCPIPGLTDAEYADKLGYAQRKEAR